MTEDGGPRTDKKRSAQPPFICPLLSVFCRQVTDYSPPTVSSRDRSTPAPRRRRPRRADDRKYGRRACAFSSFLAPSPDEHSWRGSAWPCRLPATKAYRRAFHPLSSWPFPTYRVHE